MPPGSAHPLGSGRDARTWLHRRGVVAVIAVVVAGAAVLIWARWPRSEHTQAVQLQDSTVQTPTDVPTGSVTRATEAMVPPEQTPLPGQDWTPGGGNAAGVPAGQLALRATPVQWGGGFVTGISTVAGQISIRTDVGGAYRWNPATNSWVQLMSPNGLGAGVSTASVLALAATPGQMMAAVGTGDNGHLITSTNQGASWTTVGSQLYVHGNDEDRYGGSRMASWGKGGLGFVFGSQKNGLLATKADGSVTPLALPGVLPTADVGAVAVGAGQLVVGVNGAGLYRSTDGTTFSQISSITAQRYVKLVPTSAGTYVTTGSVTEGNGAQLKVVRPGGAVTPLNGGWQWVSAYDASPDGQRLIVLDGGDLARDVYLSTNGGASWTKRTASHASTGGSWARVMTRESGLSVGDVAWDSTNPSLARLAEGSGMWEIRGIGTADVQYRWASTGIRELCANDLAVTSQGIVEAHWDRPVFLNRGTGEPQQVMTTRFNSAWAVATAPNDPNVVVAIVDDRRYCCTEDGLQKQSSLSTDGGSTWTRFASLRNGSAPEQLRFGTVAVGMAPNPTLLWESGNDSGTWRSTDQGATWTQVAGKTGHFAYWLNRHTLIADPNTRGKFWWYQGDGLKVSTDDGRSWSAVASAAPPEGWATIWAARLNAFAGQPGTLLLSSGNLEGVGARHWLTRDGGRTWRELTGAKGRPYIAVLKRGNGFGLLSPWSPPQGRCTTPRIWGPVGRPCPRPEWATSPARSTMWWCGPVRPPPRHAWRWPTGATRSPPWTLLCPSDSQGYFSPITTRMISAKAVVPGVVTLEWPAGPCKRCPT